MQNVQFIETLLASGRYNTASEVVRAGLRLLEKFEAADGRTLLAAIGQTPTEQPAPGAEKGMSDGPHGKSRADPIISARGRRRLPAGQHAHE
jgi:putative addiction module CopG family antidote